MSYYVLTKTDQGVVGCQPKATECVNLTELEKEIERILRDVPGIGPDEFNNNYLVFEGQLMKVKIKPVNEYDIRVYQLSTEELNHPPKDA